MALIGSSSLWGFRLVIGVLLGFVVIASLLDSADGSLKRKFHTHNHNKTREPESSFAFQALHFIWQPKMLGYTHVWPAMKFGWKIVVGTVIGFFGSAFGSVGGVGGGGIFVPMLTLIIGFDAKSSTAISKCMIMGGAGATVYFNLRQRHPTLDLPIIDYDLALLFQPMLVLGISIGVAFNVIFADWMVTVLLIILFLGTSTRAFLKGLETWKKETMLRKEAARRLEPNGSSTEEADYTPLPGAPATAPPEEPIKKVSIVENVCWKETGILFGVWVAILALEIGKNYVTTCSVAYWALNLLQIPVAFGASGFQAVNLYKGRRVIASKGDEGTDWKVRQLVLYCAFGILAGMVGGLLGLGGGFILGPLFLELGIPPQVASATATFAMTFSSSMSVVEYYLLKRFPVPYAAYFTAVALVAALVGQHIVRKLIIILRRASLIIFILAFMIFVSAISLGGVGIKDMVEDIEEKAYMGFENICTYKD
uniref:Sulfite exporter TauE/SafE family protein n=1 Tax=Kalanchoe fedtschenkoi TaxID=63787 RepID=A0A7N0TT71_KALFE